MPLGMVQFRADGAVDLMNPVASALLQSVRGDDTLRNIYASLTPLAPDLAKRVRGFSAVAGTIIDQQRLETPVGGKRMVPAATVKRLSATVFMAVLQDVTTLAEQERKLDADRQKFFAIFDNVRDYAIYTTTMDGNIDEWNRSLQRFGGWLAGVVQGRDMSMFLPPDDPDRSRIDLLVAQAKARRFGGDRGLASARLWGNTVITAQPDEVGDVRGFVVVTRDITERKRTEDDMKLLATVDPLTGAYNRRQGDALLAAEFTRRARDVRDFAVLLLDIDHFKAINDQFVHSAGDAVLRALVRDSQKALRPVDILVRWGREEFLLVLPNTDSDAARIVAERIRAALAATEVTVSGATIRFTVSIGVATPQTDNLGDLLHTASTLPYMPRRRPAATG